MNYYLYSREFTVDIPSTFASDKGTSRAADKVKLPSLMQSQQMANFCVSFGVEFRFNAGGLKLNTLKSVVLS